MTESAYSSIRGAEISERSTELMLPSSAPTAAPDHAANADGSSDRPAAGGWRTEALADALERVATRESRAPTRERPEEPPRDSIASALFAPATPARPASFDPESDAPAASFDPTPISDPMNVGGGGAVSQSSTESPIPASPRERPASVAAETTPAEPSGRPLPGDRGPRDGAAGSPRPSFWRRIALGRRAQALRAAQPDRADLGEVDAPFEADPARGRLPGRAADRLERSDARTSERRDLVARDSRALETRASEAVERRIVEPLLQALVSVEAKLERSHVDLIGRSDQVEQRLTQLWDIEEQLGALGDLQESVLQVTEQQRRLEAALVAQTRLLRWLVGGIILSLAIAAFCVAFFLRVAS